MRLSDAPVGSVVRVVGIEECYERNFLMSIGIVDGTLIEVVSNLSLNPLIVLVKGTKWGIGRQAANKVEVICVNCPRKHKKRRFGWNGRRKNI